MELPTAKESSAQPFSLLGEAAVLGQPLLLPGRMFGSAHHCTAGAVCSWEQDVVVTLTLSQEQTLLEQTASTTGNELGIPGVFLCSMVAVHIII